MNKAAVAIMVVSFCATSVLFAYNENSKAAKYSRGEISANEYLDHLGAPKNDYFNHGSVQGEFKKNEIGEGYTYKDNTGRTVEIHKRPYGLSGYDIYSNE